MSTSKQLSTELSSYHSGRIKFRVEAIGLYSFKLRMQQAKIALKGKSYLLRNE